MLGYCQTGEILNAKTAAATTGSLGIWVDNGKTTAH